MAYKASFVTSAAQPSQYPKYQYPEFAFLGRSNTGKSSLLEAVLGYKKLVKTSSKPGHTQTINFFVVNDKMSLADLPGYGYAEAPAAIRVRFEPMIREYITARENLRLVFLLIDSRRSPEKEELSFLELATRKSIPCAIVLTKTDKLTQRELKDQCSKIAENFGIETKDLFLTSSKKGTGIKDLLKLMQDHTSPLKRE